VPDRPPSLQDVLKRRQASSFVGRVGEIRQFEENLRLGADDMRRIFLFSLHGTAGVGKTTLLKQLVRIARDQDHVTGLVDEVAYDIPSSLQVLTDDLESQSVRLRRLRKRLGTYQQRRIELDSDPGAPSPLTKSAVGIAMAVAKEVPVARTMASAVDAGTIAGEVDRYQKYLRRKFRNPDDVQLLLSPDKMLTQAFLADLREIAATQPVALFFDTFEYTGTFLEPWLLGLLAGHFGAAPPNIVLTIAGQHPLALNRWGDYLISRADLPLAEFTEDEARKLLAVRGVTNDDVVETILHRSRSLPLLVASYSEGKPEQVADLGDPTNDVIERFLKWETEPKRRTAALLGALPRSLNRDVFAIIADSSAIDEEYARLRLLPFVKEHTEGLTYHDLARNAMLRQIRGTSPAEWRRRHLALADHFHLVRDGLELEDRAAWRDERWQLFAMEEQYHRLCANAHNSLKSALGGLATANIWRPGMAARWARMIHQAGIDADDAPVTKRGDRLATWAESGTEGDRLRVAADLAEDPTLDSHTRALAYLDRGYIRATKGEFDLGLTDLNRAVELWPGRDNILAHRGEAYRKAGRFTEALADLHQAIKLRPDYGWALASRARTYVALKQTGNALVDLNRVIDLDPKYVWAIVIRGGIYHDLHMYQDALTEFSRALEIEPEDSWVLTSRGRTYAAMQRPDDALADLGHAIDIDPEYTWAITARAEIYISLEQTEDARTDLIRAVDVDPEYTWALFLSGTLYHKLHQYQDALVDFNRAIELNPRADWVFAERSQTHIALGNFDQAFTDLNHAIQLDPDFIWVIGKRGILYHQLNRHQDALVDFNRVIELQPQNARILAERSQTHIALGDFDQALTDLNHAIQLDPDSTWAISKRGILYHQLNRHQAALADYNRAIELNPRADWVFANRAHTYLALGWFDDALADLDRAIEIYPEYGWALLARATELQRRGRFDDALTDLERILEMDPNDGSALDQRGMLHRATGHPNLALADFEKSIELDPGDGWAHYEVALTLRALGRAAEAEDRLNRAIEVDLATMRPIPADAYRRLNIAVYQLALDRPDEAEAHLRATLTEPVLPTHIQQAIDDFERLHESTGRAVERCVEILRAALP
jgi:tetratricopeptide (TPR) repeat protein